RGSVGKVTGNGLDAGPFEAIAYAGVGKAGDPNHAFVRGRALGHARQGRSDFAGDPQQQDVTPNRGQLGDQIRRRLAQKVLKLRNRGEALWQVCWTRHRHYPLSATAGSSRDVGAAGIDRIAPKSIAAATANPGQSSD